jgi:hypothetical protein
MVLRTIIQSDDDFALFAFITIGTIGPNAMVNEIQTTATIPILAYAALERAQQCFNMLKAIGADVLRPDINGDGGT